MTDQSEEIVLVDPYEGHTLRLSAYQVHQILDADDVDPTTITPEGVVEEEETSEEQPETKENNDGKDSMAAG